MRSRRHPSDRRDLTVGIAFGIAIAVPTWLVTLWIIFDGVAPWR